MPPNELEADVDIRGPVAPKDEPFGFSLSYLFK